MQRTQYTLIENNVIDFLDEVQNQIKKKIVCCNCEHACEGNSRCALAMNNLLVDIHLFMEAYKTRQEQETEEEIEEKEKVVV